MRRGKKFAVLLLILLFFAPKSVSADDAEYRISESGREQGGIELDSQRYPYEHYSSITHTEGSWVPWSFDELNSAANGLADMFFSLTKNISSLIDSALAELYAISVVERLIGTMTSVGEALYDTLFSSIGTVLFVIAVLTIFVYFAGERNASKAGKATLKLIFVVGITSIWMANASDLTRTVNSWSNELQAQVMTVGTFLTDEEVQEGNELEGSQALLRNYFFDLTVYKPYLIMNYGSTDEEIINENNPDRVNHMLSLSRTADGLEARENLARDEVEDIGNHAMSQDNVWNSVGVSILSIAFVLLLGIPVLLLALVNLLLELLVLILAIAIPLAFLISLLPAFANSGWGALQKLLSVFIMKIFVGFLLLLTFVIVVVMDELIPPTTPGMYMLNLILVSVVLFLMILKRDKIIQTISGGRVASVDAGVSQRAYNSGVKAPASFATRMAKKGAVGAVGVAGYGVAKLRERNQQRKAQKPEGTENGEQTNKDGTGKETQNTKPSLLQRFKNGKRSKQGELENQNQTKEKGSKETKNDKSVPPTNLNEYREKRNAERNKGNGNKKEFESKEEKNSIPYQKASGDGTNKRSRVRTPQQEKNFREYNGKKRPTKWESNKQLRSTQAEKEAIKNRLGGKKPKIQGAPSLQTNRGKRIKQSSLAQKEASATRDLKQRRIREADRKPKLNPNKQTRKPKLNRNNQIKKPKRATSTRKRSSQSAQAGKTRRKIAGKIATQTAHAYASSKARRVRR